MGQSFFSLHVVFFFICLPFHVVKANTCGQVASDLVEQVIDDENFSESEWPWAVALFNRKIDEYFCSGSLISAKHVLSGEVVT